MLSDLKDLFAPPIDNSGAEISHRSREEVRYAAAALLIICAKSDFESHPAEQRAIMEALERSFLLKHEVIESLLALADEDTGTRRLQEFTALVNQYYSMDDKMELIENLWRVAFADGRLDQFELHYISRVAFLIRLSPDRIQACREIVEST